MQEYNIHSQKFTYMLITWRKLLSFSINFAHPYRDQNMALASANVPNVDGPST